MKSFRGNGGSFSRLKIVYEDDNVLLVDKQPGLICHPDDHEKVRTLLNEVQSYLSRNGNPRNGFSPALCNRIDRFTGGIVIIAKNEESLKILDRKIRDREIEKDYLCIIHGRMKKDAGALDNYIIKNTKRVTVVDHPAPEAQHARTLYRTLETRNRLSLMECRLLTGRTHQIRAQFAHAGHPLLGDNQYGDHRMNEPYHREYQALYAYKLTFRFASDAGILNNLNDRSFEVERIKFIDEYFPPM